MDMDSRFHCCCGPFKTHVEKGALVIAIVGAFMNCASAFVPGESASTIVMYFLNALLFLSIIVAIRKRKSKLFLPYLVIEAVGLCFAVLAVIYLMLVSHSLLEEHEGESAESKRHMQIAFVALIVAFCLNLALNFWFYTIIYRAYKFMREEKKVSWNAGAGVAMV